MTKNTKPFVVIAPPDQKQKKPKPKARRVRVNVDNFGVSRFAVLLKEVLQEIPEQAAVKLVEGHLAGRTVVLAMHESSHGPDCKTAFSYCLTDAPLALVFGISEIKLPEPRGTA